MKNKFWLIIDDTGFNKDQTQSQYLKGERATFCGVIIHEENISATETIVKGLQQEFKRLYGQDEFHFTEMGGIQDLSLDEFCEIVDSFIELLYEIDAHAFIQSIGDCTYADHPNLKSDLKQKFLSKMQMSQNDKSNCLVLTVLRAKKYIEDILGGELVGVVCDEGIRQANTSVKLPLNTLGQEFINIDFKSSKDFHLLQLADFVAWSLSREKQILSKASNQWTEKDERLIHLFSDLMELYANGTQATLQLSSEKSDNYFPYDEVINIIRNYNNSDNENN